MQQRQEMVSLFGTGRFTIVALAESFGVSRKTAAKWLARYADGGMEALTDRSRAPYRHPNATPPGVVAAILRAKAAHPHWGPEKLFPPADAPEALASA